MPAPRDRFLKRFGLVLALALAGLLVALPAHAGWPVVTGTVSSSDTGPILGGALVEFFALDAGFQWGTSTRNDGTFSKSLDLPNPDPFLKGLNVRVRVTPAFHWSKEETIFIQCTKSLTGELICPEQSVSFSTHSRYGNVEGVTRMPDGSPSPFQVCAFDGPPDFFTRLVCTNPNASGFYRFPMIGTIDGQDQPFPMYGYFQVPEGGSKSYLVLAIIGQDHPVTVKGGEITRLDFVVGAPTPTEDRANATALGRPGCSGDPRYRGKPCNVTTGNMYAEMVDLVYPSAFGPIAFSRSYNSQSTFQGSLGLGWTHPFDFELKEPNPGVIRVRSGDGSVRFYELVPGSTDTYRPAAPARDTSTLVKHAGGFTETEKNGLRREFDLSGKLHAIVNRLGWRTALSYSGTLLTSVIDPGGRTLTLIYAGSLLTRVEGPGGLFVEYVYDTQNRIVAVKDALGARWTYSYTDTIPSLLASVRDANGNLVEEHTYDTQGRVIASTGADGVGTLTFKYVDQTHTEVTDSLGRVTSYTFGNFGDMLLITQISGPCPCGTPDTTFEYDNLGQLIAQTDGRGNTTRFEYNADGDLVKVTDALGQATTRTYNAFGQVLTKTDAAGATTTFVYDEATGFLRQVTDALGNATLFTPDARNLPASTTNPRGFTTSFTYTPAGLPETTTDPVGAKTTLAYDASDRLVKSTDALGGTTVTTYDTRSRVLTITNPVGGLTQFRYDAFGNLIEVTDPSGRKTTSVYDAANRRIQVTDSAGGTTKSAYDSESNLVAVTDARGNITQFTYDAHNRLASRTDPLGATEAFGHDAVGNLTSRTTRKGQTISYRYDPLNRQVEKVLPDGTSVSFTYDPVGRLLSATDSKGTLSFTYDLLGRPLSATSQDARVLNYSYDQSGNRVGLRDDTGMTTSYSYDPRNLLAEIADPRAGTFTFEYDALRQRIRLTRPNGTVTSYTHDPASRLTGIGHGGPTGPFDTFSHTYDPAGNRTGEARNQQSRQFAYDAAARLAQVVGAKGNQTTFTYDPTGNRLSGPASQTYQYDGANRLIQDTARAYTHDPNGNLVEKRRLADGAITTYTYDAEDRLVQVVSPRVEVTFRYDPLGRRTEKQVIRWQDEDGDGVPDPNEQNPPLTVRYLYDQANILAASDDRGREGRFTHGPGIDEPLAASTSDGRLGFFHADALGSVISLTDPNGTPVRRYHYGVFGIPQDFKGDPQPFRFTGREWDREIGLYYYRARYYDPSIGRFLSEDPLGLPDGLSAYAYVRNNPTTFVDPLGLQRNQRDGFIMPWPFHNPIADMTPDQRAEFARFLERVAEGGRKTVEQLKEGGEGLLKWAIQMSDLTSHEWIKGPVLLVPNLDKLMEGLGIVPRPADAAVPTCPKPPEDNGR